MRSAKAEGRILLTRDFELYQRAIGRGLEAFYVQGTSEAERLAELAKRFGVPLEIDMDKSHCPRCNAKLKPPPKSKLKMMWKKTLFCIMTSFGSAPIVDTFTGREHTGNKSTHTNTSTTKKSPPCSLGVILPNKII